MRLERVYQNLTPDERMRACIEAFARRDWVEADRLNDTCAEITIRTQNPTYFERLRGINELAMLHGLFARDLALGFMAAVHQAIRSEHTKKTGNEASGGEQGDANDDAYEQAGEFAAKLAGHQAAWGDFCAELGLDPQQVEFSYYREHRDVFAVFENLPRDEETHKERLRELRDAWRKRLARVRQLEARPSR